MTAGLSSAPACVRVIIRDVAGKHSWDSAVLYGPPPSSPNSPTHTYSPHTQCCYEANVQFCTPQEGQSKKLGVSREDSGEGGQEDTETEDSRGGEVEGEGDERQAGTFDEEEKGNQTGCEGDVTEEETEKSENRLGTEGHGESSLQQILAPPLAKRVCREAVPAWDSLTEGDDALDETLQYLGYSSPECLQRAGTLIKFVRLKMLLAYIWNCYKYREILKQLVTAHSVIFILILQFRKTLTNRLFSLILYI